MKSATIFALLLCSLSGVSANEGHPVEKIINLLKDLQAKAVAEGQAEEVSYAKFTYWCSTSTSTLKASITDENEQIDELTNTIAGNDKEITSLAENIDALSDEIASMMAAAKEAKEARLNENDLWSRKDQDLTSTIAAISDALAALKGSGEMTEGAGPAALELAQTQVKSVISLISLKASEETVQALTNFAKPDVLAKGDRAAHVDKYKFKSGGVIELLKGLKTKFQDEKTENHVEELNAVNSFELAKQARDNAIEAAELSKSKKTKDKADTEAERSSSLATHKDLKADRKADTDSKETTEKMCATKKSEWDERSSARSNEIAAMKTAVAILAKASGVRTKAPGNPVPPPSPVALLQVSALSDPKTKAVALIRQAGKDAHSKALERLAVEVSTHLNGPFDSVNAMVQKMIFRLMNEQKDEDEHKLWCDKEMSKSNKMKVDKQEKLKSTNANLMVEKSKVSLLQEEIVDATNMINDMNAFMQEATEIRSTGKHENQLATKDAKDAQTALANAIAVLQSFYKESGAIAKEAWEFIQAPQKLADSPSTWESSYTSTADPQNQESGIISILEKVAADFSQMEADTRAQEAADQQEYEADMQANKIEKARRTQEKEMKEGEKKRRVAKIANLESNKKETTGQLEKTEQYLTDLKPACVNGDSSYEDRKAARTKETAALRDAQQILKEAFATKPATKSFMEIRPRK